MKFASYIKYTSAPETIAAMRAQHRAYLAQLFEDGKLLLAGPFTDGSGAMFVHEAIGEHQARQFIEDDPFFSAGLFASIDTKPWTAVFTNAGALGAQG